MHEKISLPRFLRRVFNVNVINTFRYGLVLLYVGALCFVVGHHKPTIDFSRWDGSTVPISSFGKTREVYYTSLGKTTSTVTKPNPFRYVGMALVVVGLFALALSAVNWSQRLADLSRYSASTVPSTYDSFISRPLSQLRRFDSPDSKAGLPSYETAVLIMMTRYTLYQIIVMD